MSAKRSVILLKLIEGFFFLLHVYKRSLVGFLLISKLNIDFPVLLEL